MSIGSMGQADFSPILKGYTGQGAFRFWCQTVLPLVYDDSLSYYELLNKVVTYLNNTISDVSNVEDNVSELATAYDSLQNYVNDYFDSLDLQSEINRRLDEMAEDGTLDALIEPYLPSIVSEWLSDHITPTSPAVDSSLSVAGAAADAKATGDAVNGALTVRGNATSAMDIDSTVFAHGGQWYVLQNDYPNGSDPDNPHFPFSDSGARILVFGPNTDVISGKTQIVISSKGDIAYRTGVSNTWNRWRFLVNNEMIVTELTRAGYAADAKAVGDAIASVANGNMPYMGVLSADADINAIEFTTGQQWYVGANYPSAWPFASGYGRFVVIGGSEQAFTGARVQMAFPHYVGGFAYRTCAGGSWSNWHYTVFTGEELRVPNGYIAPLYKKSLCIVGTSFVRQQGTKPGSSSATWTPYEKQWSNLIVSDFYMTGINNGLAGCNVAKVDGDSGNSVWERLTKSGGILDPHTNTSADFDNGTQYAGDSVDYFIVQGGGNDSTNAIPLGTLNDDTPYTFHGALNLIALAVRAKYPKAKLFFITCFRRWLRDTSHNTSWTGLLDVDYANAMVENARHNSVRCFDAWHNSGLFPYYGSSSDSDATYAWPWITRNNKHLNVEGNAFVAQVIGKWLNNEGV